MGSYHAQTTLLTQDGNSENYQSNGFAIGQIGTLDLTDANTWAGYIKAFYDDVASVGALKGLSQNGHLVKIYDVAGTAPNYPLFEINFDLASAPADTDLPQELALCVSYYAAQATTIARGRRRGRIYVSGWVEGSNTDGRPNSTAINGLLDAYTDYVTSTNTLDSLTAGIWSRSNGTVYKIDTVWVDNEWDTQRRRGNKPTSRTTWLLP